MDMLQMAAETATPVALVNIRPKTTKPALHARAVNLLTLPLQTHWMIAKHVARVLTLKPVLLLAPSVITGLICHMRVLFQEANAKSVQVEPTLI